MHVASKDNLSNIVSISYLDILAKFRLALENYAKFSFAACFECECVVRSIDVFIFQRMYIESEVIEKFFVKIVIYFRILFMNEWQNF